MSLRLRLIGSIVIVLIVSLCAGGAAAGWHAVRSVRVEMRAALLVGVQTLRNEIQRSRDPAADAAGLVHNFDGDRHLQAVLTDPAGQATAASSLAASDVPAWFVDLLAPRIPPVRIDLGSGHVITVAVDPRNEIGEVWTQLGDDLIAIGLSCGLSIVLVSLVVQAALRPLDRLLAALASLGSGEHAVRVAHVGPPELVRITQGFNAMAERLDAARERNARLHQQLLTLQEEERAELARDLHDEVGPFLFAVNLDAAAIEQAAGSGHLGEAADRARTIRDAVGHMQRHVRGMLLRLRPASPVEAGLAVALGNLVAFWRVRRPEIDFAVDLAIDEDRLSEATLATIFRLAQEALNNAVRHGSPGRVRIAVSAGAGEEVVVHVADNGSGFAVSDKPGLGMTGLGKTGLGKTGLGKTGLGMTGMAERVERLGGVLQVGADENGLGFVVTARLPVATPATRPAVGAA